MQYVWEYRVVVYSTVMSCFAEDRDEKMTQPWQSHSSWRNNNDNSVNDESNNCNS